MRNDSARSGSGTVTQRNRILAAALALAAVSIFGFFFLSRRGDEAPVTAKPAPQPGKTPEAPRRMSGEEAAPTAPPASPQVAMENDPVGPLVLEGQVLDGADKPVGGATVRLSSIPPRIATSDADGSFSFDKLVPRTYELVARRGDDVGGPVSHALRAQSDPVVIRIAPGVTIQATVVAAGEGAPVPGATVQLAGDDSLTATTDAKGVARLRGVGGGYVTLAASAPGHAKGQTLVQAPESPGAVVETRIELRRGAPVTGVVVDSRGKPIAGARVWERDVSQAFQLGEPDDRSTTDGKGRFTLAAVAAGTYHFHASHPDHAPGSSEPHTVDGTQPTQGVRIELARGGRVAGRVVDKSNAPVAWATVRVGTPAGGEGGLGGFTTRQAVAGERGEFELKGLPRQKLLALAISEEASSPSVPVDLAAVEERTDVLLRLEVSGRIEGVVVDAGGQPVAEARVTAYRDYFAGGASEDFFLRGQAVEATDGDGRFAFRGLVDGPYRLFAARSGTTTNPFARRGTKVTTGATNVRLTLEADGGIRGVVAFDDGSAPPLFTVEVGLSPPLPVATKDGKFLLDTVPAGSHDLTVRGPDFSQAVVRDVAVTAGQVRDVGVIKVERGRSVSGRVVGKGGAPVADAAVVLGEQLLGDGRSLASAALKSFGDRMGVRQTRTDGEGRFTISGVGKEKDLVIAAEHDAHGRSPTQVVPAGPQSPVVDLQLAGTGSLGGVVRAGGKPAGEVTVIATSPAAAKQNIMVTTARDGRYQIDRLAVGEYKVTAMRGAGMGATMAAARARVDAGKRSEVDIEIAVGDVTLVVDVKPRGDGKIDLAQVFLFTGKVGATNGKQVNEAFLAASETGGAKVQNAVGGNPARFTEVSPGEHSLCIVPVTGDVGDPQFVKRLGEQAEKLKVYCEPRAVAASPKEQTHSATVPQMEPLK